MKSKAVKPFPRPKQDQPSKSDQELTIRIAKIESILAEITKTSKMTPLGKSLSSSKLTSNTTKHSRQRSQTSIGEDLEEILNQHENNTSLDFTTMDSSRIISSGGLSQINALLNKFKESTDKRLESFILETSTKLNSLTSIVNTLSHDVLFLKTSLSSNESLDLLIENSDSLKKLNERRDKSERLVSEVLSQVNTIRCNNMAFKDDIVSTLEDMNQRIRIIGSSLDKESSSSRYDSLVKELNRAVNKRVSSLERKLDDSRLDLDSRLVDLRKGIIEDIAKVDVNVKALWDTFAMFSQDKFLFGS